jgi:hypothetical protein
MYMGIEIRLHTWLLGNAKLVSSYRHLDWIMFPAALIFKPTFWVYNKSNDAVAAKAIKKLTLNPSDPVFFILHFGSVAFVFFFQYFVTPPSSPVRLCQNERETERAEERKSESG